MSSTGTVKVVFLLKKKAGFPEADFFRNFDAFGAKFKMLPVVQRNILKIELGHINKKFDRLSIKAHAETAAPSYNSMMIMEAQSEEDMEEVLRDQTFAQMIEKAHMEHSEGSEKQIFYVDFYTALEQ